MKLQFGLWLDLARINAKALTRLLVLSGCSKDFFLSGFDENTLNGSIEHFAATSDAQIRIFFESLLARNNARRYSGVHHGHS